MTDAQVALERAQQRQAAMAEVLQIMTRTSFELRAVFEALVERASRLCRWEALRIGGFRTLLGVPLLRGDGLLVKGFSRPVPVYNLVQLLGPRAG